MLAIYMEALCSKKIGHKFRNRLEKITLKLLRHDNALKL